MHRRRFLQVLGTAAVGGAAVPRVGATGGSLDVNELLCYSSSSLLNTSREPLTDDELVAVWAESSAENENAGSDQDAVLYGNERVPLIAVDGNVVGIGSTLLADQESANAFDNYDLYLNMLNELVDGATILWDETHDQFWGLGKFSSFASVARSQGYDVRATDQLFEDLGEVDADAIVMQPPEKDVEGWDMFSLRDFTENGGTIFLHNQSDYNDFGQADRLNAICEDLNVGFRFNSDQVVDHSNNEGMPWEITTTSFNTDHPFFDGDGSNDRPVAAFTVSTTNVDPGDTIEFDAGESEAKDGWIVGYEWEFGNGRTSRGQTTTHTYEEGGQYTVTLTVVDGEGREAATSQTVSVGGEGGGERVEAVAKRGIDGDTIKVELSDGAEESVRILGLDTPETSQNRRHERPEEWYGIDDIDTLIEWGSHASNFIKGLIDPGDTVELQFDPASGRRDNFGRLLAHVYYDSTGDGSYDTLYNKECVAEGYARVYGSSFSMHDEFRAKEEEARENDRGVWQESSPGSTGEFRNHDVNDLFVPRPVPITSDSFGDSSVPDESRVPVYAEGDARVQGINDFDRIPLAAVDEDARVGMLGGLVIDENYEQEEGYPVNTSRFGNFPFLTNLIDYLADRGGDVLVDGGHQQFEQDWALSGDDAAYYLRHLEGQGIEMLQFNDLPDADLERGRALIVTPPAENFSRDELEAVKSFRDGGGTVILMGTSRAPLMAQDRLNRLARELDTDLRVGDGTVLDDRNNVNNDARIVTTSNFNRDLPLFSPHGEDGGGGGGGGGDDGDDGREDGSSRYTGRLSGDGDKATFTHAVEASSPRGATVTLEGPDGDSYGGGPDFDLYLTLDGRQPTEWDYDLRSWEIGTDQEIEIDSFRLDDDTELGLLVHSYTGSGEFVLEVDEHET